MLAREQIERAVDLQARGYRLLQWLEKAFDQGFIAPEAAHTYATMEEIEAPVAEEEIDDMLRDPNLREVIGLCTYASDLLQRLQGVAVGPATLALWRSFAWTPQGSPRKDFALTVDSIMEAQQTIANHLARSTGG